MIATRTLSDWWRAAPLVEPLVVFTLRKFPSEKVERCGGLAAQTRDWYPGRRRLLHAGRRSAAATGYPRGADHAAALSSLRTKTIRCTTVIALSAAST